MFGDLKEFGRTFHSQEEESAYGQVHSQNMCHKSIHGGLEALGGRIHPGSVKGLNSAGLETLILSVCLQLTKLKTAIC